MACLSTLALLASTAVPSSGGDLSEAVGDHDRHPGLGHPTEGDAHHRHGDADDHHETPDSPCHHHDTHTCCSQGPTLALTGESPVRETPSTCLLSLTADKAHDQPSVHELFHVPLA